MTVKNDLEIIRIRKEEFDLKLDTDEPYKNFQKRIIAHREKLLDTLISIKKKVNQFIFTEPQQKVIPYCNGAV